MRTLKSAFFILLGLGLLAEAQESQKLVGDFATFDQSRESGPAWTRASPKVVHAEPLGSMVRIFRGLCCSLLALISPNLDDEKSIHFLRLS